MFIRDFYEKSNLRTTKNLHVNKIKSAEDSLDLAKVSVVDCAAFALDVYGSSENILPSDWTKAISESVNGYAVNVYLKGSISNPSAAVISHRGTVMKDYRNLIADLELAVGMIPTMLNATVMPCIDKVSHQLRSMLKHEVNGPIINVGHSLGAYIATYFNRGEGAVTFENPGAKLAVEKIIRDQYNLYGGHDGPEKEKELAPLFQSITNTTTNYFADVNAINTKNEQMGKCYRLWDIDYSFDLGMSGQMRYIGDYAFENLLYLMYSLDQHSMQNIYNYLKLNKTIVDVNEPFGINQGYAAYVDYGERKRYWDQYIHLTWENDKNIRNIFGDDESNYKASCIERLKVIYKININKLTLKEENNKTLKSSSFNSSYFNFLNLFKKYEEKQNINEEPRIIEELTEESFHKLEIS